VPAGARGKELKSRATWLIAVVWAIGVIGLVRSETAHPAESSPQAVSREQASQELQRRYGGNARVVRTDVIDQNGRRIYVFRLLSANGRVWIVRIDAQSGAEVP
jgi:uncharacterized membrane protein YkoI